MKIIAIIIFGLIVFKANATSTISCSHTELCKMANVIIAENRLNNISTKNLIYITGDPHEFEPSTFEIKNLISAPILITGPNELNPWIKKIILKRSKLKNVKTISLLFNQQILSLYPEAHPEELSHFWLYPKVFCALKAQLEIELKNIGFNTLAHKSCDFQNIENQLRSSLSKTTLPVIITHSALLPLLLSLDSNKTRPIIAIKGSGDHEEASTASVKKMYDVLKYKKIIWVLETGISVPPNITNKIRPTDLVIKLDTANSQEERPFSDLVELTNQLNKIAEKK